MKLNNQHDAWFYERVHAEKTFANENKLVLFIVLYFIFRNLLVNFC
jgi:hypothetical protein